MDFIKAQNTLNKINNLFQSIQMTDNSISALEKDLMKSYIRELYEEFASTGLAQEMPKTNPPESFQPKHKPKITETLTQHTSSFDAKLDETIKEVKEEIESISEIPKIDRTESSATNGNMKGEKPVVIETQEPSIAPAIEEPKTENRQPIQSSVFNLNPEMEELFSEPMVTELSDRLSGLPITDLGRAFGVNERILTINELFGGDSHLFNNAIKSINDMSDFEDAKKYLVSHVAKSMNWTEKGKKEKASVFIKTVRRKFK